jgi:hypothetical protein
MSERGAEHATRVGAGAERSAAATAETDAVMALTGRGGSASAGALAEAEAASAALADAAALGAGLPCWARLVPGHPAQAAEAMTMPKARTGLTCAVRLVRAAIME